MDDPDHHDDETSTATKTTSHYPVLEEPSWLEDDELEEMEAPRDSAFRGIWIGAVAAGITFVLVFAVPHWLGWYDVGPSTPRASRELNPESVISDVTAKPSTSPAEPAATVASTATPPPAVAPPDAKPATAGRETKPAKPAVTAGRRTFAVQIAAFKNARQAGRVAENAKRAGYAADVLRVESSAVPWVVRVGGYATREQAESAREALARKGFRGGFIL
ncbi:MAG TPA: SPOR domain-containing protein [Verrucomicrobiae bacterium]|nr:SPOR domain-containing protein [Verrucomicrobiae bacterium]